MASRHATARRTKPHPTVLVRWDQNLERAAIALVLLLSIARPCFPSEDAQAGSGLFVIALWGLAALFWATAQAARSEVRWFASWVDVFPIILLAAVIASALWAAAPRPAINLASEWVGLTLSYFLVRQLFRQSVWQRTLVAAMVATAFALAAYGIHQAFWGLESLRAEYARDRLRFLQELEIPPNSPREEMFKNRLNSHEPFATFALANSLAGFLLAWLPLGIVLWIRNLENQFAQEASSSAASWGQRRGGIRLILGAAVIVVIALCLVLTQSRTAYVGLAMQVLILVYLFARPLAARMHARLRQPILWVVILGGIAIVSCVMLAAVRLQKIDAMLFTQASKSLGYRWQYWRATADLVRDRFWTGTGPGNFRGYYLKFKLAESSEEIADPHNMILEICATSGAVAGVALLATIGSSVVRMIRRRAPGAADSPAAQSNRRGSASGSFMAPRHHIASAERSESVVDWPVLIVAGAAGMTLAAILSSDDSSLFAALLLAWFAGAMILTFLSRCWMVGSATIACAVLGLAIHLLGAGGIGIPGVAGSLWILLALGLNMTERNRATRSIRSRRFARVLVLGLAGLLCGFGALVLRPVTGSQSALQQGREHLLRRDWAAAETQFRAAAVQDRLAAEPWIELSRIHYEQWLRQRGSEAESAFSEAVRSLEHAARLAPLSVEPHRLLGELFEARATRDDHFWKPAIKAYERCVEIYPTSAMLQALLANAMWHARDRESATHVMKRALELDALTPHPDKKLAQQDREVILGRLEEADSRTVE